MFLLLVIFILDIICFFSAPQYMDKTYISFILILAISTIIIYSTNQKSVLDKKLHKIYIRHSVLFIFSFCVVLLQRNIDYVLGIIDNSILYESYWIDQSVVCKSLALSNCCLCSFIIGYFLFRKKKSELNTLNTYGFDSVKNLLFWIALLLEILVVLTTPLKSFDRKAFFENSGWFTYFLPIILYAIIINYSIQFRHTNLERNNLSWFKFFKTPLILSLIYVVILILYSGSRGGSITLLSFLLISYIYCLRTKINFKKIALLGLIGLFSMSMIGIVRSLQQGDTTDAYQSLLQVKTIFPFSAELAGSVNTLHIAMAECPEKYPFDMGASFVPQFLKIVPGSFGLYNMLAGGNVKNSAEIITEMYFGKNPPEWSWGMGSSVVADAYISFGLIGCIVIFMFFGWFYKYMEYIAFVRTSSIYMLTLSFLCFSQTIFIARSSFSDLLLFWPQTCVVLYFIRYLYRKRTNLFLKTAN